MKLKVMLAVFVALAAIIIGVAVGSVYLPPGDILSIVAHRTWGAELPSQIRSTSVSILWNLRLPRAILAFMVGAMLSVSGAVMQSLLRNPLASSYTLGVSSGASLGACLVILYGLSIPLAGALTLPLTGFVFGLGSILLAMAFASRLDNRMENNTIILVGMVFSLFVNAVTTLLSAISGEHLQQLFFWQMGSFSMKDWQTIWILLPIMILGGLLVTHYNRELDIMTFGEEQAQSMGVDLKRTKRILLVTAAAMTGSAVAFVGVIGFVDLVAPHIVRRLFGSAHRLMIAMTAVCGGTFMVICDLAARTLASPRELPVGAVTALIGAPFFAWIYFSRRATR
ncbi:MAG: iron ABC transporter permease [Symbiobacteriaceae bacterium]|nr:iron ABC transporter permease [Symbiobacteriaceae bacterium]